MLQKAWGYKVTPTEVSTIVAVVLETLRQTGQLASTQAASSIVAAVTKAAQASPLPQAASSQGRDDLLAALSKHAQPDGSVDLSLVACELGITRRAVLMRIDKAERAGEMRYIPGEAGKCGRVQMTSGGSAGSGGASTASTQNASPASKTPIREEAVEAVEASSPSCASTAFASAHASALTLELNSARSQCSEAQDSNASGQRASAQSQRQETHQQGQREVIAVLGEDMHAERKRIAANVRLRMNREQLAVAVKRWAEEGNRLFRNVRTRGADGKPIEGDVREVEGVEVGGTRAAYDADFAGRISQADIAPSLLAVAIKRCDQQKARNSLGFVAACLGLTACKPMQLQLSEQPVVKFWDAQEKLAVDREIAASRMLAIAKQVEAKAGGGA